MKQILYKTAGEPSSNIEECLFDCTKLATNDHISICYAKEMGELAKEEAHHHDEDDEDPNMVHQLDSWRNKFYHNYINEKLTSIPKFSTIIEIGAGSGGDAKPLFHNYNLILTDVSPETLNRTYHRLKKENHNIDNITFIACDGEHLPFADKQADGVFMVATFHHFENPKRGIDEVARVLKSGGTVVLGVEPNKTYFKPINIFQKILFKLTHTDTEHISKADAEMQGFSHKELQLLFLKNIWQDINIKPMWLLAGFMHYAIEFIFRAFKLKKRISIPQTLEKLIVSIDEFLFKIPGIKHLCWHWIISAKKK